MTTRRSPLVCNLLTAVTAGCLAFAALSLTPSEAQAAKKKRPEPAKAEDSSARPPAADPVPVPVPVPVPAPAPAPAPTPAADSAPLPPPDRKLAVDVVPAPKETSSQFEGGFFRFNLGYASDGGEAGPLIPDMTAGSSDLTILGNNSFASWRKKGCLVGSQACYPRAIRSDVGAGLAVAMQIGYNFSGYASMWADLSWHGSLGSKADIAGAGTVAAMLGIHPLRFWRSDLPVDVMVYGGYGLFEILYYYETEFQTEAKGKAWTGASIPFGLLTEYRFKPTSPFSMGLDLRLVQGRYNKWIYNNDKDYASNLDTPHTTLRFEPRLTLGWHF